MKFFHPKKGATIKEFGGNFRAKISVAGLSVMDFLRGHFISPL